MTDDGFQKYKPLMRNADISKLTAKQQEEIYNQMNLGILGEPNETK